ncbi:MULTISPECIES: NAD-dependent DNA ligase LigA [unclassified Streptomyces]|uniref:NAD-dependent DNA ligase LigA n=1 Tax=unclassified Streptomyces TaxID=2593676 RepID=UPI0006AD936B|nr:MULTISPECIES: NAD-dependent DNA ligase LigA [unclassified Streptomyces]KOX26949.1 DNA ligase [Streptomyces sp. NRRL F-6491]KOX51756.1 DNA ligase [Streptomyces sp. NRRL F-6492]
MTNVSAVEASFRMSGRAEYEAAVQRLREASHTYYGAGYSLMDDAAYDRLRLAVLDWEAEHPAEAAPDSPTDLVADGAAPAGDVAHTARLLSLDNVFAPEQLVAWGASLQRRLGHEPAGGFTVEPKMDGAAVAARYRDGRLVQVITRGDGTHGEDVSHVIGTVVGLPEQLPVPATFEARGEVLFTQEQFEAANEIRAAHGGGVFANPRNGTAGTLRAKDRPYRLAMTFWAYGAVELDGVPFLPAGAGHAETLAAVARAGVRTTADTPAGLHTVATLAEAQERVDAIAALRASLPFGIDGVVVKADSATEQATAGFGTRFPYWAVAYKLPAVERQTVLQDVFWEVGRTGVLAPTAVLAPVELDGSTVTRATLHNPADILRRDLHIGDTVTVYKAGDIIPRVQAAVVELRPGDAVPVPLPRECPHCGGEIDKSQERWRCAKGTACALAPLIEYAAGRDILDIDGLGRKYVDALIASGDVGDVADLFTLTEEQLATASGSAKRGARLAEQIRIARSRPLSRVFCALGIPGTGRSMSRRIAAHFGTMEAIRAADADTLQDVEGIGPEKAPVVVGQVAALAPVIDKLIAAGVTMTEPRPERAEDAVEGPLSGKTVVVTGRMTGPLDGWGRSEMGALIEKAGGRVGGSVNSRTTFLVAAPAAGGKPSSKAVKAREAGVEVLTPEDFAALVADYLD